MKEHINNLLVCLPHLSHFTLGLSIGFHSFSSRITVSESMSAFSASGIMLHIPSAILRKPRSRSITKLLSTELEQCGLPCLHNVFRIFDTLNSKFGFCLKKLTISAATGRPPFHLPRGMLNQPIHIYHLINFTVMVTP
jgi:hypothetical protein